MKQINQNYFNEVQQKKGGIGGRAPSELAKALFNLEVGHGLEFSNLEWNLKTSPFQFVANATFNKRGMKFRVKRLVDGWAILKTK